MQTQRINIILPTNIIKQLNASVPRRKRSQFIAKVVSEKLQEKNNNDAELKKSLEANHKFYQTEYKDWKSIETESWPE